MCTLAHTRSCSVFVWIWAEIPVKDDAQAPHVTIVSIVLALVVHVPFGPLAAQGIDNTENAQLLMCLWAHNAIMLQLLVIGRSLTSASNPLQPLHVAERSIL